MEERPSIVVEEYLQEIYLLETANDSVKAVQIASRLNTTPSTVHATLSRMKRDSLIKIDKKKNIHLTQQGKEQAQDLVKRHNLAEYFLCNILQIPWYEVHKHAHRLEHAMTPLVVEKLDHFLGYPEYCPHGVPIQGYNESFFKDSFELDQAQEGMNVKILMIDEVLENAEDLLKHLHQKSIVPGSEHLIRERLEPTRSLTLEKEDSLITLPFDIAQKIRVIQVDS